MVAIELESYEARNLMQKLFRRGYRISSREEELLKNIFLDTLTSPKILTNSADALICFQLKEENLIKKFYQKQAIIHSLLSFQTGKQVGYRFNHLQIANNFLEHHKDFNLIFLKAVKLYGYYEQFSKKESFEKKESFALVNPSYQDTTYNDVIFELFPELKQ